MDFGWDESYTLPENLYLAFARGGGERYRNLARRFLLDKTYFDPLAEGRNVLPNHHAYSFCNALSSAMQAYLVDGSIKHLRAASNAFDMIASGQSFATGGWGPNEAFVNPGEGKLFGSLSETHRGFETPCGSYAHFKLTRYLLRVTRDGRYGDSMERVLYNTVLGAKRLESDGRAFYYSDYHLPGQKSYFPDKWPCCSGTLPQVAADYRICTYFRDADGIYVNLYLPSTLRWTTDDGAQVELTQNSGYPVEPEIAITLRISRPTEFALRVRLPAWSSANRVQVNGAAVPVRLERGFATIRRRWRAGDRITVTLGLPVRLEPIDPQHPGTVALMRGPLVLFAVADRPVSATRTQLTSASRVPQQIAWHVQTNAGPLLFRPFTEIGDQAYCTYVNLV
jgi:DUF1680 family protein